MLLGVNIDHIATLREARKINDPNPLEALFVLQNAGASQVTLHLREDRRHIHDEDVINICTNSPLPVNLESSIAPEIIDLACLIKPHKVTLVPEKREEVTTEGGLNLLSTNLSPTIAKLQAHHIEVSLFIDAEEGAIAKAKELGADSIELHTGEWANLHLMAYSNLPRMHNTIPSIQGNTAELKAQLQHSLQKLKSSAKLAKELGLSVYAGHGLNYQNISPIAKITEITELNIGHSIIARSIFIGLSKATREMLRLIREAREDGEA